MERKTRKNFLLDKRSFGLVSHKEKRIGRCALFLFFILLSASVTSFAAPGVADQKKLLVQEESFFKESSANLNEVSGIEAYIKNGLMNNPGLRSAFYRWKAAFKKISKEFSLPDPEFSFTEYLREVETRVGPQERAFSVKQKIPLPDKLWIRRRKAFNASLEAYHLFRKKKLEIVEKVTEAYYEYVYLNKSILLMEENIKLLKNLESVIQTKYKSALAKNQDLLRIQVELGRMENDLVSLQDMRAPLSARLNALLNRNETELLSWPENPLDDSAMQDEYAQVEALYDILRKKNPDLLALSSRVDEKRDALKLARREYFPDLTVGVTQIDTGEAMAPGTVDSGKDPLLLMFSVNVPLWFNRLDAGVDESRALLTAAENSLKDKQRDLISRFALVHYKVRDALRQAQLYKDALLPKATQALNATQSAYESGQADFLSLIDAQRVLLNFQLAYYRHNADFYQRLAELKNLLGEAGP